MQRGVPVGPLVSTAVCIAAVNVLLAQVIALAVYPGAVLWLGPVMLVGLAVIAIGTGILALVGWREYLRKRRGA